MDPDFEALLDEYKDSLLQTTCNYHDSTCAIWGEVFPLECDCKVVRREATARQALTDYNRRLLDA
jgi:hypothetical protein